MQPALITSPDGVPFRDLNHNGTMEPYEDPRLAPEIRTEDLLARMSIAEKIGMMFQTGIGMGDEGSLVEEPGPMVKATTSELLLDRGMNHFNVHHIVNAGEAARWNNAIQRMAERTPHGIPVTISTDPRHAFVDNIGTSFAEGPFSKWPDGLGLAALRDVDTIRQFARAARDEYRAVGIRAALHPQVDLATDPRWTRGLQTFGADPAFTADCTAAYLDGFQGANLGTQSVACTTKHFPGAGPQKDGEDAHFPYGREQVYPGGAFEAHLAPFRTAVASGTAAIMPYYGMPKGLALDGVPVEEVGFGYNRQILTGLLREQLGYDGVIVTDWELVTDNVVGELVLPARAWGVERLDARARMLKIITAGADQFGGEHCTDLLADLVSDGSVSERRIDESVRRLLLVKFQLGLFEDPFVDEELAVAALADPIHHEAGRRAQSRSVVLLENPERAGSRVLPVAPGTRVYIESIDHGVAAKVFDVVDEPADADLAIVRIGAPFEPRDDLFLEAYFHQGSLEFRPGLLYRLEQLAAIAPLHIDVMLDRPAILSALLPIVTSMSVTFGVSDEALLNALSGREAPSGVLPVHVPRSADDVRHLDEDRGLDATDALYPIGYKSA